MTDVDVSGVHAAYGEVDVLKGVDLHVPSGALAAILGASGSGKTTLLRVLAGFIRPSAGTVYFGDRQIVGPGAFVPPEKRRVGIVPQEGALFPHLDVGGNVGFGLPRGRAAMERVDEVLDLVGLADLVDARPQELSGGQQQRVAVARALAPQPDVVLLDEPFSALDAGLRSRIREEILGVLRSVGTTSILVTHDQEEALSMADLVSVMRDGRLVQTAPPRDLYRAPIDVSTARFVGDLVELPISSVTPATEHAAAVECSLGVIQVEDTIIDPTLDVNQDVIVLRPEQLTIREGEPDGGPGTGRVQSTRFHGHDAMVTVQLSEGAPVEVRVAGAHPPEVGDEVQLRVTGAGRRYRGGREIR